MHRPFRIAAVVAATALLIGTAGASVVAIEHSVAGSPATSIVSADGPVLLGGASAQLGIDAAQVLGPIDTTALPSIKRILATAAPAPGSYGTDTAPSANAPTSAQGGAGDRREQHEREGGDD